MVKQRTVGHERFIDKDKLAQRVKSLPLGREEEIVTSDLKGPLWMKRIDAATRNLRRSNTERWSAIQEEKKQIDAHNEKISKAIEQRRLEGHPFGV